MLEEKLYVFDITEYLFLISFYHLIEAANVNHQAPSINSVVKAAGGRGGGLHENFSEIDFLVVSYREDWYLSDAFDPMKKYCS